MYSIRLSRIDSFFFVHMLPSNDIENGMTAYLSSVGGRLCTPFGTLFVDDTTVSTVSNVIVVWRVGVFDTESSRICMTTCLFDKIYSNTPVAANKGVRSFGRTVVSSTAYRLLLLP
jgi:hypothetical protein